MDSTRLLVEVMNEKYPFLNWMDNNDLVVWAIFLAGIFIWLIIQDRKSDKVDKRRK